MARSQVRCEWKRDRDTSCGKETDSWTFYVDGKPWFSKRVAQAIGRDAYYPESAGKWVATELRRTFNFSPNADSAPYDTEAEVMHLLCTHVAGEKKLLDAQLESLQAQVAEIDAVLVALHSWNKEHHG